MGDCYNGQCSMNCGYGPCQCAPGGAWGQPPAPRRRPPPEQPWRPGNFDLSPIPQQPTLNWRGDSKWLESQQERMLLARMAERMGQAAPPIYNPAAAGRMGRISALSQSEAPMQMTREQLAYIMADQNRCDDFCDRLAMLEQTLRGGRGNKVLGIDTRRGQTAGYIGTDLYHGGLLATVPQLVAGDFAGGIVDFVFSDEARARMGGTSLCSIYASTAAQAGATSQPINAAAAASTVELLVNGVVAVGMVRVNLLSLLPTLNGPPQAVRLNQPVRPGDVVSVRVNFAGLGGSTGNGTTITWVVDAGDCPPC